MANPTQSELSSRDTVLKLLSDDETARVSMAETKMALPEGTEYLDLEQLDKGIQRASSAAAVPMDNIIPRTAVSSQTWGKILAHIRR